MKSSTSSSLFFILCLCLIFYAPLPAICDGLYEKLCNEAKQDANNCLNLLKDYSNITSARNYIDLSRSILEVALDKSKQAEDYLYQMMKENPNGRVKQCATEYYGVKTTMSLQSALDELIEYPNNEDYYLTTAASGPPNCDAVLEEQNLNNSTIHSMNIEMSLFCKVALLATNHLVVEINHRKLLAN